jgi:hypothetical protein
VLIGDIHRKPQGIDFMKVMLTQPMLQFCNYLFFVRL